MRRILIFLYFDPISISRIPLPLLSVVECQNIREQAADDLFDFVLGDIGFIDYFLAKRTSMKI